MSGERMIAIVLGMKPINAETAAWLAGTSLEDAEAHDLAAFELWFDSLPFPRPYASDVHSWARNAWREGFKAGRDSKK